MSVLNLAIPLPCNDPCHQPEISIPLASYCTTATCQELTCFKRMQVDFIVKPTTHILSRILSRNAAYTYAYTRACTADYNSPPRQASGPACDGDSKKNFKKLYQLEREQWLSKVLQKHQSSIIYSFIFIHSVMSEMTKMYL